MMTLTRKKALEIWQSYNNGILSSEQALFQCMFFVAKPSQRKLWTLIHQHPGITTAELQLLVPEWTIEMVATTCKNLLDMGLVRREQEYIGDNPRYQYYVIRL